MAASPLDDLLQPSLGGAVRRRAPYSSTTGFLASFFGGPLAALVMAVLDSHRLGRLRRDAAWIAAAALGIVAFEAALRRTAPGQAFVSELHDLLGSAGEVTLFRLLGLAVFALASHVTRFERRSAQLMGVESPNGWLVGLPLALGGPTAHRLLLGWLA